MKKNFFLLLILCLLAAFPALAETAAKEAEPAEWTVLFYFCGADLESHNGFASEHLQEIRGCFSHIMVKNKNNAIDEAASQENFRQSVTVNVAIQTGGSRAWDNEKTGLDIRADVLQRWSYTLWDGNYFGDFRLETELPLQSMANPETLADFIQWGTRTYPAKKYALVLWGHGDGAKTGIFVDELFDQDVMHLDELAQALADGGAFFEAVLLDACMMANLETANALKDSAAWMIASEEMVPGRGTAVKDWLQELYDNPWQDGKQLGRNVCDMTLIAYANSDNDQAKALLTWSVIDLSKIGRLNEVTERVFDTLAQAYAGSPVILYFYAECLNLAEEYGDGKQDMRDIFNLFYSSNNVDIFDVSLRSDMIRALSDAVVYCVRGSGRCEARGLSFCYAVSFTKEELDIYARNCMSPRYLAFLDNISSWTAPAWVYEALGNPAEMAETAAYAIRIEKRMSSQGVPGFIFTDTNLFSGVNYTLYRLDEKTKQTVRLGRTMCRVYFTEDSETLYSAVEPWLWPSIDGEPCAIEMISATDTQALYSVPIRIGTDVWNLRYGRDYERFLYDLDDEADNRKDAHLSQYTVYGLWEGYDNNTSMMNRNVISFSQMTGQDYRILYPVDGNAKTGKTRYITGGQHTLYRSLDMEAALLPAGTYYLEYEVQDMFMRPIKLDRIEIYWDGKSLSFPEDFTWEGTIELKWE